ncbi:MAG: isoleucine--tRNA ligase [Oscillospiraceae bacterium]|nr:isoleucine--tRNA ligase [Oscillospiraceae bacterium]
MDYNKTLNLPQTEFPMRAGLPQREPEYLKGWNELNLYEKAVARNKGNKPFILHDGPPYANGDIHIGHALNKILKDFIVRYKLMAGYYSPFVPGFDTHGLPIELRVMRQLNEQGSSMSKLEVRKHCREYAMKYVNLQTEQFKRLGLIADWDNSYKTLASEFEAEQIRVFGKMVEKGYIYKGLKPVYWCSHCETALAEAEIEYSDDHCTSIYVKFNVTKDNGIFAKLGVPAEKVRFIIWTTTTWTIPANVGICLNPAFEYSVVKNGEEYYVIASELVESTMKDGGVEGYEVVATAKGEEFEYCVTKHPYFDRDSLIMVDDYVTMETGTGCVHNAPGHGLEDFEVCKRYDLPMIVPVDSKGRMTEEAGLGLAGKTTEEAGPIILEELRNNGSLFASSRIEHQYPHCWRCHEPVLFRATQQWFCSVKGFAEETVKAINTVQWKPEWGKDRMTSMVMDRTDWCISRQRTWGVPIPAFYCTKCGNWHITPESIEAVATLFEKEGSDAWYIRDAAEILPAGTKCAHCGGTEFTKEQDIMDVWFDSGSSHAAVLKRRGELSWPCDLYLEGGDQYRGWFQSSLLTAVAVWGESPYKQVVSHGWTVDDKGRKMSKSMGNGIDPTDVANNFGADILRLLFASCDYHSEVKLSQDVIKQLADSYRKVRNTARFILGNLYDFNPNTDAVAIDELEEIDKWALNRLNEVIATTLAAYEAYEFNAVYRAIHSLCVIDLSNFYLDVLKDRLYVEKADSKSRRAAQTTIYHILRAVTLLLAPVLCFTSDEIWKSLPASDDVDMTAVLLNDMPKALPVSFTDADKAKWDKIIAVRADVLKALEQARTAKVIGASLEACVTLHAEGEEYAFLKSVLGVLPFVFITSDVHLVEGGKGEYEATGFTVDVAKAEGGKCERCWSYSTTVGESSEHPTLCARCAAIV